MFEKHQSYSRNKWGRDFVMGDLHGSLMLMMDAMDRVGFDACRDRMFSTGDMIDRGPESKDCLKLYGRDWFHPVLGNHEDLMIRAMAGDLDAGYIWAQNGGEWSADSELRDFLLERARWIDQNVPLAITLETAWGVVGICHAEAPTDDWEDVMLLDIQSEATQIEYGKRMLWSRQKVKEPSYTANIDLTIHGHAIQDDFKQVGNGLWIDTGALNSGLLPLLELTIEPVGPK